MRESTQTWQGSGSSGTTGSTSGTLVDEAQDKAQEVAGQARDRAQEMAGQARGQMRQQLDSRSTQAGEQVGSTAQDLRSVSEELRNQGKETPAKLADQAADRVEQIGGYLRDSDADRILNDIEDFGRRQPLAVAAAGLALGFAASRFLKASSTERYHTTQRSSGYPVDTGASYPGAATPAYPVTGGGVVPPPPVDPAGATVPVVTVVDPATSIGREGR